MWLEDEIYGRFEITEPVLKELLNAPELQRLKGISMAGYYPGCPEFGNPEYNRYNHSIGVLLLLLQIRSAVARTNCRTDT